MRQNLSLGMVAATVMAAGNVLPSDIPSHVG
jgi:hypothetical protein